MTKQIAVLLLFFIAFAAQAQTFQVFKGDTINRRDAAGLQEGVWRKYYKSDTLASEMFFHYGRHQGLFRTWSETGKLQTEVMFRKGNMEVGDGKIFYPDGTVKAKGKYVKKERDSLWTFYDEQGKMSSIENYVNGKKEGISRVFFPDGKIAEENIYKAGIKNGPHREFYPDGTPKVVAMNKNGEYQGQVSVMFPSGAVSERGMYVNGLREGKWVINKADGTLDHEENYKHGKILNPVQEKEQKLDENVIRGPEGK